MSGMVTVRDSDVQVEQALGSFSCSEPSLLTNTASCGAVGWLDQIMAAGCRHDPYVLHPVEHGKLAESRALASQLVGVDDLRHVVLTQQSCDAQSLATPPPGTAPELLFRWNMEVGPGLDGNGQR